MQKKPSLENILKVYVKRGFFLFPVSGRTKRPVFKDMLNKASNDLEELKSWAEEFEGCGWALSLAKSGLWAVDVDTRHGGIELWNGLIEANGEPETLKQETGSGGLHYVFKHEKGTKLKGKIKRGIDIKHNGYIILYPTVNKDGKPYFWRNFKNAEPSDCPTWLFELCEKKKTKVKRGDPDYKLGHEYLLKLVEELKRFELDYDQWLQAGMALHKATEGSPEGLALYLDLTQGESFKEGDIEQAENKWGSFDASEDGSDKVTERTLTYLIRKKGGIVPNPSFESDVRVFAERQASAILEEAEEKPGWFREGLKHVCVHPEFIVEDLNEKGFSFLSSGGDAPVLKVTEGPDGQKDLKTMKVSAFHTLTGPYFYKFYKQLASGERKACYTPAAKVWIEAVERKTFDKIVFKPNAKSNELNLWSDIPCERKTGDVADFLIFIEECICDGNKFQADWLLDWLAHLVQRPWEKSTLVPVLIGDQGTGKGLLVDEIMAGMLGHFYNKIMTAQTLKERFNVEQSKRFLTFIDEATWRGDKVEDGVLKSLTGSATMAVEEKFGARYIIENFSRYIIASNNPEAVAISRSNRRYFVIEAAKRFAGNTAYFEPLWEGVKRGNLINHVFDYLMQRDISKFNPFLLPQNSGSGRTAKIASEGVVAMFWEDVFFENPREVFLNGEFLMREAVYQEFLEFANASRTYEKNLSRAYFWRKTNELMPVLPGKGNRHRVNSKLRPSTSRTDPERLAGSFAKTLCIEPPEIEPLEFFMDEELAAVELQ